MTHPPQAMALLDRFGRAKRKLRVSLTDRCNFRCPYCMPENPQWLDREHLLDFDQRLGLLELMVRELGIQQLRLTGGEPLLYPQLLELLAALQPLRKEGLQRISMTSNGYLLERQADALAAAGLDDLNVSLDAVEDGRFRALSGGRALAPVLAGITASRAAGLPVKLNAVLLHQHNADQLWPLLDWAAEQGLPLRFIEFMPLDGRGAWSRERVVTERQILDEISTREPRIQELGPRGPASYYELPNRNLQIGIIPTITRPFCGDCDRLRLTAAGELLACLFSTKGPNLKQALAEGADRATIKREIRSAVWAKDEGYVAHPGYTERTISMHGIGG